MKPLSEEARAVTQAGKRGEAPTAADRERVRAKLAAAIAAGAVGTGLAEAATPARWWTGGKLATASVAAAVVTGGALWVALQRPPAPVTAPAPVAAPAPGVVALPEAEVLDEPPEADEPAPSPAALQAPRKKHRRAKPAPAAVARAEPEPVPAPAPLPAPAPPPVAEDTLEAETRGLRDVHQALRDGDPARALALLKEQTARFPRGQLREEREAAEVLARCARSPDDGRESLATFARQHPGSVLLPRLRKSCEP